MFKPSITRGGGAGRILPIATITNQAGGMMTKYIAGAGVGATSVAVRRLKLYKATTKQPAVTNTTVTTTTVTAIVSLTPTTIPDTPTITSVSAGYNSVTVYFTVPTNNVTTNPSYTVVSNPGNVTITRYSSPITVTGLTNGVTYTFTVVATNSIGSSAVSNTSNAVIPNGSPPAYGTVQSVVSFFDNGVGLNINAGTPLIKMCIDTFQNVLVAYQAKRTTFTINKSGNDGITQIPVLTDTFVGTSSLSGSFTYNLEVIKYNSTGVPQWVAKIGGDTNQNAIIYDMTSDVNNNVYVLVAHSTCIVTYYNSDGSVFGKVNSVSYSQYNTMRYCLVKYNSAGFIQWINTVTVGNDSNSQVQIGNFSSKLITDSNNNIFFSAYVQRYTGGVGPTTIKFYNYASVNGSQEVQFTLTTTDSYEYGFNESHRGFLIKIKPNNNYDWIARIAIPNLYGPIEYGAPVPRNMVIDSNNNIYLCIGSNQEPTSPEINVYNGVSTNPLSAGASPYYRLDLRGNSLTPPIGDYHKFAAILKFDNNGVFQRASCVHQQNKFSGGNLDMNPYIGIDKRTGSLYLSMNAEGFVGTNAATGAALNKLYVNNFSSITANGSNYDIKVSSAYTMILSQPQKVLAIVKYDGSLQAQTMTYINTPSQNSACTISVDSNSKVYITTVIRDTGSTKTIYTYNSLSGTTPVFNAFGNVNATAVPYTDGLVVCYTGDLTGVVWAAPIRSSDGMSDENFSTAVDDNDNFYVVGVSSFNTTSPSAARSIQPYNYTSVSGGNVVNSLFGNIDVTNATSKVGYIIKYI
jgi:hypothetical protein